MPQLIEEVFDKSPTAQMVLANREIKVVNRAAHDLFGYDQGALVGQSIKVLYPTAVDYAETGSRVETGLARENFYEDERFMRRADGSMCWMRARGVTLTPQRPFDLTVWSFELVGVAVNRSANLTQREQEIAREVVNGKTCKEIGQKLGISHRTVEVHRARLMQKLDARNTAELVTKCVVLG